MFNTDHWGPYQHFARNFLKIYSTFLRDVLSSSTGLVLMTGIHDVAVCGREVTVGINGSSPSDTRSLLTIKPL